MGKVAYLILKIFLGAFAATNLIVCIITTDMRILIISNISVAFICIGIFYFIESKISLLSTDFGITRNAARELVGAYFVYYKNVERISIDEYYELSLNMKKNSAVQ